MSRRFKISTAAGLCLLGFIVLCRYSRPAADFYSLRIYPAVSAVLSFISSAVPFSLGDVTIATLIAVLITIIILAVKRKWGWKKSLSRVFSLALWTFVWFYMGWCVNYSRSSIFMRAGKAPAAYEAEAFKAFLSGYTDCLNATYADAAEQPAASDESTVEAEIKEFFGRVPAEYGLCSPKSYQHVKPMLLNWLQTSVGVTGYEGPLFAEFHLNSNLKNGTLRSEYPFTFAHEYSHLMGVSSEAEANWWAYCACRASGIPDIRYSAYFSILAHVWNNASRVLQDDEFEAWRASLRPEVVDQLRSVQQFWRDSRNKTLDKVQSAVYDAFLKGNNISSGMANYSEVISIIMTLDE